MNKNLFRQLFSVVETEPRPDYSFEPQQSTKQVGSLYGLQLAGYMKNLLLMGFDFFSRQVGYVKSCMTYPFSHKAIPSCIN